jgi:site-specific DNA-methyltransferase (adenine-specific)
MKQDLPSFWTTRFGTNPYAISDCIEGMKKLPDGCVDMVLTDPPFNVGIEYESYDDNQTEVEFEKWLTKVMIELDRITKSGPIIVFFRDNGHSMFNAIEPTKLKFNGFLKWFQPNSQRHTTNNIFRRIDLAFILSKGKFTHHPKVLYEDVLKYNPITPTHSEIDHPGVHPCPRPYKLYEHIIKGFTNPGDIVLDPFLGSGTTLRACHSSGRIGLGFEIDKTYEEMISYRMKIDIKRSLIDIAKDEEE